MRKVSRRWASARVASSDGQVVARARDARTVIREEPRCGRCSVLSPIWRAHQPGGFIIRVTHRHRLRSRALTCPTLIGSEARAAVAASATNHTENERILSLLGG